MSAPSEQPIGPESAVRLRSFEVQNFRLLKDERLEVHPDVTVLVGLNDVGKSTLLEAIRLYGTVGRRGFRKLLSGEEFEQTGKAAVRFSAEWEADDQLWRHSLTLDPHAPEEQLRTAGRYWSWKPRERTLETPERVFHASGLTRYASLARIDSKTWQLDTDIPAEIYEPMMITRLFQTPPAYLFEPHSLAKLAPSNLKTPQRSGYGWTTWLQEIINRREGEIEGLEKELQILFPHFKSVRVGRHGEASSMRFRRLKDVDPHQVLLTPLTIAKKSQWDELGVWIRFASDFFAPAERASSGLLLALAHFALVYASQEGALLLLEEPENGLNARITLEMMRRFLAAVRRRRQQLILTTHNAWWLDLVLPESIRVLTRDESGAHIHTPPKERVRQLLEEQDLYPSEIMGTYGPEGLLYISKPEP